jgi:hypothetical protein
MKAGVWVWHEAGPIRLDSTGQLCSDGMHRLLACAVSGIPLRTFVLVGDQFAAGLNTDKGRHRTLGQYLAHLGWQNSNVIASSGRYLHGRLHAADRGLTSTSYTTDVSPDPCVIDLVDKYAEAFRYSASHSHMAPHRGINLTAAVAFLTTLYLVDPLIAESFHQDSANVTQLPVDDPLAVMLARAGRDRNAGNRAWTPDQTWAGLVYAYNKSEAGETLRIWRAPRQEVNQWPVGFNYRNFVLHPAP